MKQDIKQDIMISARVTPWMKELIEELALEDERTVSWTIRKLLTEALEARGLIKDQREKKEAALRSDGSLPRKPVAHSHPASKH